MTPFAIFFLRQFFLGISREIEEAAMIDGAGHFRIFFRLILPMSTAPIITLAILTYIAAWNEYFWPLLVGQDETAGCSPSRWASSGPDAAGCPDWPGLMAATLLAALPIIILFAIFGSRSSTPSNSPASSSTHASDPITEHYDHLNRRTTGKASPHMSKKRKKTGRLGVVGAARPGLDR